MSGSADSNARLGGPRPGSGAMLELIRARGPIKRSDLASVTGMGRATVSQRIAPLLAHELVVEAGDAPSTGGRPPLPLAFNPGAGLILAADLGATHARLAVSDLAGRPLVEDTLELAIADGPDPVLGTIEDRLDALLDGLDASDTPLRAVGIGVPGPVEHATGRSVSPPIMPGWDDYEIKRRLQERFAVPALVDNDVNIMAIGEHSTKRSRAETLLFVKVGTGIGCGIILNGEVHRGAQGAAGDIGHIRIPGSDDVLCECGNRGCLEAVASGRALARVARERGLEAHDGRDVVALVRGGERDAVRLVREAGRDLGHVLSGFVNGLNPEAIVVGGDVAEAAEPFFAGLREVVYQRSTTLATRSLEISPSALGPRAGIVGAALMASDSVLAPAAVDELVQHQAASARPRG